MNGGWTGSGNDLVQSRWQAITLTNDGPVHLFVHCQPSNIRGTLVGNKTVDHSDVVGAPPVGPAPNTSSFLTSHLASMDWEKTTTTQDKKHLRFGIWCILYLTVTEYASGFNELIIIIILWQNGILNYVSHILIWGKANEHEFHKISYTELVK